LRDAKADLLRRFLSRLKDTPPTAAELRIVRKQLSREVAGFERGAVLEIARGVIAGGIGRVVAYELVMNHLPTMSAITTEEICDLGRGIGDWDAIDGFACLVSGPAQRQKRLPDAVVRAWARSDDWCWRRMALVSTVPLNSVAQGGRGATKRTLRICTMLIAEHDLVVKALSWALRELGKRDPVSVREFLATNRDGLARRVLREVENKLDTGLKNPR
jgi:3-methyladenine DNA glycosylase AlkD